MLKNFLIRLFAYPFCVFIFYLSYQMVFNTPDYSNSIYIGRAQLYGSLGLLFSFIYPISDISIIIRDYIKKHKSQ